MATTFGTDELSLFKFDNGSKMCVLTYPAAGQHVRCVHINYPVPFLAQVFSPGIS